MDSLKVTTSELRCRVNIYSKTETLDAVGGLEITYPSFTSVWAKITDWRGYERYLAERTNALVSQIVVIRPGTSVGIDDVVVYQGRTMPVKYITSQVDGKVQWVVLFCMEGDPIGWTGTLT
jgi:SPP1 family predicted phage head-tail adaptor